MALLLIRVKHSSVCRRGKIRLFGLKADMHLVYQIK